MTTIAFIGGGHMAGSIIGGLVAGGWPANQIYVADRNADKLHTLQQKHHVHTSSDNSHVISKAKYVVLAVKPQAMQIMLSDLQADFAQHKPGIISVAAGITCDSLRQWIAVDLPIIRAMPNMPSLLGLGATGLYANEYCQSADRNIAQEIMQAVGITSWVEEEKQIDVITGISGSGPAYFYQLMEIMRNTAIEQGLSDEIANALVRQTALGAATIAHQSEAQLSELIDAICISGGTTQAAINTMQESNINGVIAGGIEAAIERAAQLAKTLSKSQ